MFRQHTCFDNVEIQFFTLIIGNVSFESTLVRIQRLPFSSFSAVITPGFSLLSRIRFTPYFLFGEAILSLPNSNIRIAGFAAFEDLVVKELGESFLTLFDSIVGDPDSISTTSSRTS